MNALTYDECKSDMNTNTALIVLTSRPPLRATMKYIRYVQCTFAVLQGQPWVLDVVFRAQVVLQLQGLVSKQKELTRKSLFIFVLAKIS